MNHKQTDIPRHDLEAILGKYSLRPVEAVPLYLGMDNINIRVSTDDRGCYVLKICSAPADTVHAQLKVLRGCGSPDQQPIRTAGGASTFAYGERIGYLLPFIAGEDLLGAQLTRDDVGRIAAFHRAAAARIAAIPERPAPNIWDLSHFCVHLAAYARFIPRGWATPEIRLEGETRATVHNDFTRSNLLRRPGGAFHLLDYGDVSYGLEITDLAVAMAHFCVEDTPRDRILTHVGVFLAASGASPDLRLLYRLIRLRFVQAVALTLHEEELFGAHPRADYWLNLGRVGVELFEALAEHEFVSGVIAAVRAGGAAARGEV